MIEDAPKAEARSQGGESSLRRELGAIAATAIVVNATVGTGIFKTPAKVARSAGSIDAALGVWVAGGVVALAGALCIAELSAAMPRSGGIYEVLRRAFGARVAFLYGWAKITLLVPSAVGSFALLASESVAALMSWPESRPRDVAIALAILAGCAGANVLGVRASGRQQTVVTAVKYVGLLTLAFIGLTATVRPGGVPIPADPPAFQSAVTAGGVFAALVSAMWAYDGWADLSSLGGETRNPGRVLPRALLLGTLAVMVAYLVANLGYARVLGLEGLRRSTTGAGMAAAHVASLTWGDAGRSFLSALVLTSCVGGCMASLLTNSRAFVPMATDGTFVRWLGRVHDRSGVPRNAIVVSALLGALYVGSRTFEQLTDAFVVGYFPFYAAAIVALLVLRRREPRLPRPFRVPWFPLPPLVFLAGALAVMAGAATDLDGAAGWALLVIAAGVPISFLWKR
ncbi:MAG: amino acid permease [Deltaproteobacteria bacterium]|nr:amino acid permease [Deltaproteobacteria bacterium]